LFYILIGGGSATLCFKLGLYVDNRFGFSVTQQIEKVTFSITTNMKWDSKLLRQDDVINRKIADTTTSTSVDSERNWRNPSEKDNVDIPQTQPVGTAINSGRLEKVTVNIEE
jgi:hypothetical protein